MHFVESNINFPAGIFYQLVMESVLFYDAICLGGSTKHKDAKLVGKTGQESWLSVEKAVELTEGSGAVMYNS